MGQVNGPKDEKLGQVDQTFTSNNNILMIHILHWNSLVNALEDILDNASNACNEHYFCWTIWSAILLK